jgi:hypothetical protein
MKKKKRKIKRKYIERIGGVKKRQSVTEKKREAVAPLFSQITSAMIRMEHHLLTHPRE